MRVDGRMRTYNMDGKVLFPIMWFYWMFRLNNIAVTASPVEMANSSKLTHRMFGELVNNYASGDFFIDYNGLEMVIIDLKQRKKIGVTFEMATELGTVKFHTSSGKNEIWVKMRNPYTELWSVDTNKIGLEKGTDNAYELSYVTKIWKMIQGKYPIQLISGSPVSGLPTGIKFNTSKTR